jgi:hypothetical protein
MSKYDYFWCPGCDSYKHRKFENIVRVAHMTEQVKRTENLDRFYTTAHSFLCDHCKLEAEAQPKETQ